MTKETQKAIVILLIVVSWFSVIVWLCSIADRKHQENKRNEELKRQQELFTTLEDDIN